MLGMMQVLVWLGCTVVVLLGLVTLQVGLASSNPKKGELIALGYAAVIIGVGAAVICFGISETHIANMGNTGPF